MIATVHSATLLGVEALPVEAEVELARGLPIFSIIGLADRAVQEARYRIQSAIRSAGLEVPRKKVTINLAPANRKKDGSALDLPMVLGVLVAAGIVPAAATAGCIALGELALSGELRPVRGVLPAAAMCRDHGFKRLIVPKKNAAEALVLGDIEVVAAPTLLALVNHLRGECPLPECEPAPAAAQDHTLDLSDVRGQSVPRRALEIAATGRHNLLLVGPPGSGKTMLARRLPSILPPLTVDERVEVTKIWSVAGLSVGGTLVTHPPFRAPHHSISAAGLIGGGSQIRPGEVSLAHRGVLFLDELPELPRRLLDTMRQPLEDREVTIARAREVLRLPATFMLVGAANPCPCGWFGDASGRCRCPSTSIAKYGARISGPLLDRIDLVVTAHALDPESLVQDEPSESSAVVRTRVEAARQTANARGVGANSELAGAQLRTQLKLSERARRLIQNALKKQTLSARALDRTLKVSRTIADLSQAVHIEAEHIAEALAYRRPVGWALSS